MKKSRGSQQTPRDPDVVPFAPGVEIDSNPWHALVHASSGEIRRLASVWRFSSIPISVPENVADHSFWVALYSIMIHQELQRQASGLQKRKYGKQSVLLAIVLKAITHDMGEAVTGDVVRVFKYSSTSLKEEIDRAEKNLMGSLLPMNVTDIAWMADRTASDADASVYVQAVVKAADFMSLYQFMRREVLRGNCEVRDFIRRMVQDFSVQCPSPQFAPDAKHGTYPYNQLNPYYRCLEKAAKKLHIMVSTMRGEVV